MLTAVHFSFCPVASVIIRNNLCELFHCFTKQCRRSFSHELHVCNFSHDNKNQAVSPLTICSYEGISVHPLVMFYHTRNIIGADSLKEIERHASANSL